MEIVLLIIIFLLVIGIAYFITKQLASLGTKRMQGKNIKILETMQVGINQQIHLVQTGNDLFMIGVSKERISYLKEIDKESIDFSLYQTDGKAPSFEHYLKEWTQKRNNRQ